MNPIKCAIFFALLTVELFISVNGAAAYKHWNKFGASGHPYGRCLKRGRIVPCKYNPGPNNYFPTTSKPWDPWKMKMMTKTTTTTTTEDPDVVESNKIRNNYIIARELSAENLFGITQAQADNFTSRVFDELDATFQPCNRTLPKFTDCKIQELAHIFKTHQCAVQQKPTLSTRHRQKRALLTFTNRDGSVSRVISCSKRGDSTKNKGLRLCTECQVITKLPEGRFPRYLNEATCDLQSFPSPGDRSCLTANGQCIDKIVNLQFRRDEDNIGLTKLHLWKQYTQSIRSGCSCAGIPGAPLAVFIA